MGRRGNALAGHRLEAASVVIDLSSVATNLEQRADGVWQARTPSAVAYPRESHACCFQLEDRSFWFRHRNACILDAVRRYPPRGPIFDIGGGNGFVAQALQQAGMPAVLVEPGPDGIANARKRGVSPLVQSTLEDAGFLPASLPAAGLFDVIEHIERDETLLATLGGLIAAGGRLYLTTPAYEWLWSAEDEVDHYRRYTRRGLARRVTAAGFRVDYATYFFAPLPLPILFLRAVPSRLGRHSKAGPDKPVADQMAEHGHDAGLAVRAMNGLLGAEAGWLARGHTIGFGASILLVATRS